MTHTPHPNRRDFIRTVAAGTMHGVASGDPLQDRVMLWTRITPDAAMLDALARLEREARTDARARQQLAEAKNLPVHWEVARDRHFRQIVARGTAQAGPEREEEEEFQRGAR